MACSGKLVTSSIVSTVLLIPVGLRMTGSGSMTSRSLATSSQPTGLSRIKRLERCWPGRIIDLLDVDEVFNFIQVCRPGLVLLIWEEVINLVIHFFININ